MDDSAERYRTRFGGCDLPTLHALVALVASGDAVYDTGQHCWWIAAEAVPEGLAAVAPDADWQAADAAMRAAATPPERRPLAFARAVTPAVTMGLDETLSLVLQVPKRASQLTISDGDALKVAIGEARAVCARIESEMAADAERYGPPGPQADALASMDKTRQVDGFGNVSYQITRGGEVIGQILKCGSGKWQVEPAPFTSFAPVGSVKTGMLWLARYGPGSGPAAPAPEIETGA
jgi:hypothetical protein